MIEKLKIKYLNLILMTKLLLEIELIRLKEFHSFQQKEQRQWFEG